ncbi:hypothetical protein FB451DRAFT_1359040 [Mycena latifolia]|nr:hypothetical protein FB451DRAFT_1359040 [Mycena latifolia]
MKTTVHNTFGVLFIVVMISASLYGAGILQFWMYIRKYHSKDPKIVKCLVVAILICDTFQQALLSHAVYTYLGMSDSNRTSLLTHCYQWKPVSSMENPLILPSVVKTVIVQLFFSCAIGTMVQQFYCWRIYKIGKNIWLAGAVSGLSWVSCVLLLVYAVKCVRLTQLSEVITLESWGIASNVVSAATDMAVSIVLVILLHSDGVHIQHGCLEKLCSITWPVLIVFFRATNQHLRCGLYYFYRGLPEHISLVRNHSSTYKEERLISSNFSIFFFLLMGRLYTTSMLVTLNSREYIISSSDHATREQYSLGNVDRPRQTGGHPIAIRIDTMHGIHQVGTLISPSELHITQLIFPGLEVFRTELNRSMSTTHFLSDTVSSFRLVHMYSLHVACTAVYLLFETWVSALHTGCAPPSARRPASYDT